MKDAKIYIGGASPLSIKLIWTGFFFNGLSHDWTPLAGTWKDQGAFGKWKRQKKQLVRMSESI